VDGQVALLLSLGDMDLPHFAYSKTAVSSSFAVTVP
jgi:hypothetical protein